MNKNINVDVIIIGSSPLLMLYALQARQEGKSVILIEEINVMGGAWSLNTHLMGVKKIVHENACHLIEWYAGGYELIEHISEIRFLPLVPQPIKVWCNGKCKLYTSRTSIFIASFLAFRSLIYSFTMLCIKYKKNTYKRSLSKLTNAVSVMKMELCYRLLKINEFNGIRIPEGGYSNFINNITNKLKIKGVNIINGKAESLLINDDGSGIVSVGKEKFDGLSIVVGESSVLLDYKEHDFRFTDYYHVLVSLNANDTICRNSYIHFPDHQFFHRITYVEDTVDENNNKISIFLIQLRTLVEDNNELKYNFNLVQSLYPIVSSVESFKCLKSINSKHISSSVESGWHHYGETSPIIIKTIGDLSRNILLMKHKFKMKDL